MNFNNIGVLVLENIDKIYAHQKSLKKINELKRRDYSFEFDVAEFGIDDDVESDVLLNRLTKIEKIVGELSDLNSLCHAYDNACYNLSKSKHASLKEAMFSVVTVDIDGFKQDLDAEDEWDAKMCLNNTTINLTISIYEESITISSNYLVIEISHLNGGVTDMLIEQYLDK